MGEGVRRTVTRGYVTGLIAATLTLAAALVVASWGLLGVALGREPIESDEVPLWFGVFAIAVGLAALAWLLWRHAIVLLRGRKTPSWGIVIVATFGVYLLWCLAGILGGLSLDETWTSPYAVALAPIWGLSVIIFWGILARRVYTDRPTPQWPWERREERG